MVLSALKNYRPQLVPGLGLMLIIDSQYPKPIGQGEHVIRLEDNLQTLEVCEPVLSSEIAEARV